MLYFDRFDVCEAYYAYAVDYHSGQWSRAYAIFGRLDNIHFKPSCSICEKGYEALTENGKEIYDGLVTRNY